MEQQETEIGRIHIYCGDGKGKTTASVGLAVRAAGRGKKVLIVRFLKNNDSGELTALSHIPGITVVACEKEFPFFYQMTNEQKTEAKEYYSSCLANAFELHSTYDMLVLDEIMAACRYELIDHELLLYNLKNKASHTEIVMTGREPSVELMELADYISEIRKIKHPYEQGVPARKGIEF